MADDWAKLEADCKKLEPQIKKSSLAQATKLWQALLARDKVMDAHEKMLTKAATAAYEKGVKSKTVLEFMKDKAFSDAKKLLDTDRRLLVNELYELKLLCEGSDDLAKVMDKLSGKMAKAIKAANDDGPAGIKAKKLRDDLAASLKDVNEAAALRFKPDKYLTSFNQQYDKLIDHLLAEALKKVADTQDSDDLPAPLADKKLKASVDDAEDLADAVKAGLDQAVAAKEKDPKTVATPLKKASTALSELKKLSMRYQSLRIKFKKDIATAKDKTEIETQIGVIVGHFNDAEVLFKKTLATLKA